MDPLDAHEWVSVDHDGETYLFDVTFLTSPWTCIFGAGCQGVLTGPAPELVHGCCTYGAHFVDKEDRKRVEALAEQLTADEWQLKKKARKLGGPIHKNEHGEWVTRTVKDACIFLNRVGFPAGPGCALHQVAVDRGERPLDWKPTVCWQLPLRLEERTDDVDHRTWVLREWKRRDWGEGGLEFHWWCTEGPEAFVDHRAVYETLREEIVELVGEEPYRLLCEQLDQRERATETFLPHPALKKRA
ncbi:MAG: hypothetical protein U0Q07_02885 [Acidimicrobiales bacterium]